MGRLPRVMTAAAVALATAGCAPTPAVPGLGKLVLGARFPLAARTLSVIPEKTHVIVIRVTGDRIPAGAVLSTTLTPDHSQAVFEAVPAGWKTVTAQCFDGADVMLATGETTVLIEAMRTASARVKLVPVSDEGGFNLILQ